MLNKWLLVVTVTLSFSLKLEPGGPSIQLFQWRPVVVPLDASLGPPRELWGVTTLGTRLWAASIPHSQGSQYVGPGGRMLPHPQVDGHNLMPGELESNKRPSVPASLFEQGHLISSLSEDEDLHRLQAFRLSCKHQLSWVSSLQLTGRSWDFSASRISSASSSW